MFETIGCTMATPHTDNIYAEIEIRPWEEVRSLQEERLRTQVKYLASESAFYRKRFDEWDISPEDIRSLEDLHEVPLTSKDDERRSQESVTRTQPLGSHQAAAREEVVKIMSSSGTTGDPTFFGLTPSDWDSWLEMGARAVYACGVRPDDVWIHAIGRTMVPGGDPYVESIQRVGATVVPAGDGSTERILKTAEKLSADGLFGTASYARYLINRTPEVVGKEVGDLDLRKLIGGGEPGMGNPEIRSNLHDAYGAERVSEVMGIGDVAAALSGECAVEEGMHYVGQEFVLMELIDPETGEHIEINPGAEGEIVYTPLTREATPLLRFRSGDYARIIDTDCSCGRTAPRFQIIGRADDMLIYKAQNVYPAGIREVIAEIEGASPRIKVVKPSADKVQFNDPIPVEVVKDGQSNRPDSAIIEEIQQVVRDKLGVRVDPHLVSPGDVELSVYKTDLVRVADE